MIHFPLNVWEHERERDLVARRIHDAEHVHFHGHAGGGDGVTPSYDVLR